MKRISINGKQLTAKEYLQQIYHIKHRIDRLTSRRDDIRNDLYSIGSPSGSMDADKVQTTMSGDSMLRMIARVDETERDIVQTVERLMDMKDLITSQIEALEDERYKNLLLKRYVLLEDWGQISDEMYYTLNWVYNLHGYALAAFAEKYGSET